MSNLDASPSKSPLSETVPGTVAPPLSAIETSCPLPDEPLVSLEHSGVWSALNLKDLWRYRELLYFLTWRDVKVRYKQTAIGVLWIVMQPLLMTIIFTVFLGMLARV